MADFRFTEQKQTSLRHKITEDIRSAIFQGKLKPGDRLREVEISKQMGVSRGPIREAIRMLEQEGLLYSHPYKETTVAEITEEEVREVLLPIRMTIERFALTKALPRIGEAELARLESILADMKQGADYNQLSQIVNCDLAFHEYLITLADMPGLLVTWTSIFNRIHLHFMVQGQKYDDYAELWKEHTKLLDAIKSGDLERVQEELTVHIQQYK